MRKLVIDRQKWYRGNQNNDPTCGEGSKLLRRTDGKMCCLGFDAVACGIDSRTIEGVGFLDHFTIACENFKKLLPHHFDKYGARSQFVAEAAAINDDRGIPDENKEARLKTLFAEQNIELEFVG